MTEPDLRKFRIPLNGTFELTVRCNLHCRMCMFRHPDEENADILAREKTADEWIDMARQAADAGTLNLLITGGEPLFLSAFPKVWEGICRIGFQTELYTNATLVTPEIMALFGKYPPNRIGVSLYGASEESYQKVTGSGAAYQRAIEGIRQLGTLPSLLDFRTTIIRDNLQDMDAMEEWVRENFGADRVLTHTKLVMKPVRGAVSEAEACRLGPEDNAKLYFRRHFRLAERAMGPEHFDAEKIRFLRKKKTPQAGATKRLTLFGCDAGMQGYAITWDGKMLGCQVLSAFHTEPFREGFQRAWDRYPEVTSAVKYDEECLECAQKGLCLSCPATRWAETGNPGGKPPYVCDNVTEMAKRLVIQEGENDEEELYKPECPF